MTEDADGRGDPGAPDDPHASGADCGDSDEGRHPTRRPGETALLADAMLGTLTTYLRMCGYDTAYALDRGVESDDAVAALASEEGRLLLTRDAALAARAAPSVLLTSKAVAGQLRELAAAGFELALREPTRCSRCNGRLAAVDGTAATPAYAPDPAETAVWRCRECGQHYWKGSHWDDVADRLP